MNIKDILLIAIIIYLIISYNKNIEKFALSDTDKNEMINLIRPAIKEIYNTDMEAVRQLAVMATKLNAGGLEIPGNLTVTGTISGVGTSPIGSIIMWAGRNVNLPSNWKFCDGSTYNGIPTPDLRNRFVVGATMHADGNWINSDTFNPKANYGWNLYTTIEGGGMNITGGNKDAIVVSHSHGVNQTSTGGKTFESAYAQGNAGYYHKIGIGGHAYSSIATADDHNHSVSINAEGSSGTNQNLPPYYALAYIMRIA